MLVPNRHGSTDDYRYGFQGQEKDDEIKGEGNSLNYTFRMHDPRVGRFFAIDPLSPRYPMLSPYHFSHNSPIATKEIEGLEGDAKFLIYEAYIVAPKLKMATSEYIEMARPFANLPDKTGLYLIRYGTPFEDIFGVFAGEDFEGNIYHRGEAGTWAIASFVPFAKLGKLGKPLVKISVRATSKYKLIKSGYKVGGKYTDDFVKSANQVIEGVGAKKFQISNLDEITGKGKEILNTAIERYHNTIDDIADSDVSAVIKELHGTEIVNEAGKSYNHLIALNDRIRGLKNTLKELGKGFKNGSFSDDVLDNAKDLHNHITQEVQRLGNIVEGALKSSGN